MHGSEWDFKLCDLDIAVHATGMLVQWALSWHLPVAAGGLVGSPCLYCVDMINSCTDLSK